MLGMLGARGRLTSCAWRPARQGALELCSACVAVWQIGRPDKEPRGERYQYGCRRQDASVRKVTFCKPLKYQIKAGIIRFTIQLSKLVWILLYQWNQ
jgi:hypothetical protein